MSFVRIRPLGAVAVAVLLVACSSGSGTGQSPAPPSSASVSPSGAPSTGASPTGPSPSGSISEAAWLTYHRDAARTGFDDSSPPIGSVRQAWTSPDLDGAIYAQPLLFEGRLLVATENDSVYALDAQSGNILWQTHLGEPVPRSSLPCGNIDPTGITGTPVIDPATGLLYAVDFVQPGRHELVAVDTSNGQVRFRHAADAAGADPLVHQQRAALAISGERIYAAYGGLFGDCGDYRGTVVGLALDGSGPLLAYRVPTQREAGIWGPSGPAVEPSGDLLVATGNSESTSSFDFGNSVIRLSPDLQPLDSFAPANWLELNAGDVDLGSVGPALLSDGLVFAVGKEGVGYLLDLDHLGGIGGESFSGPVCGGGAFGGTAAMGSLVFVPCTGGLAALEVGAGPSFRMLWEAPDFHAGPPIVAGGAVWTVALGSGDLLGFDVRSGRQIFKTALGSVANFASPLAAGGRLYVAADRRVVAFSGV
jgi:outer membrane protein assembly factor BamB